jgi:hypothetical protein
VVEGERLLAASIKGRAPLNIKQRPPSFTIYHFLDLPLPFSAFGNPPSPLRGPLPPRKRWGARKMPPSGSLRSSPTPKTGVGKGRSGRVLFSPQFAVHFLQGGGTTPLPLYLPPPACQGEGDHVSGGRGLLKMVDSEW